MTGTAAPESPIEPLSLRRCEPGQVPRDCLNRASFGAVPLAV